MDIFTGVLQGSGFGYYDPCIRVTGLGERYLDHRFNKKLRELEHANAWEIEELGCDLAHLQDRGRRANELRVLTAFHAAVVFQVF
jgi:hypothetical protein